MPYDFAAERATAERRLTTEISARKSIERTMLTDRRRPRAGEGTGISTFESIEQGLATALQRGRPLRDVRLPEYPRAIRTNNAHWSGRLLGDKWLPESNRAS